MSCFMLAAGCKKEVSDARRPAASASAKPGVPLDRLAPGELEPGQEALFGLSLPRGMLVQGKFKDSGLAAGPMSPESVASYVRDRVEVAHVELGESRTIFPAARIKGAAADRSYRIEVSREGVLTRLLIEDVTAPPNFEIQPLNRAEAMRRAGFTPDGKPLDLKALE
jgi:hypothetical protein